MKELDLLRQELLSCDTQLVDILMKRFDVVEKIMALKEKNQMQILQPEQESRQKEALDIELKGNVHQEEIADIYARVLYNSKKIQGKKLFDYNIVLIGFMGAGKSTISAFLRDALAMDVVEMDHVIAAARMGRPASMILKNNSISDRDIILKLQEASCAGVRIDMIVRGICCVRAGVPGKTENLHIRSLVGRYLEHGRIYSFFDGVHTRIYIASGDFLTRNTECRVEVGVRVEDPVLVKKLTDILQLQLRDNVNAREMCADGSYQKVKPAEGEPIVNSQMGMYDLLRNDWTREEPWKPTTPKAAPAEAPAAEKQTAAEGPKAKTPEVPVQEPPKAKGPDFVEAAPATPAPIHLEPTEHPKGGDHFDELEQMLDKKHLPDQPQKPTVVVTTPKKRGLFSQVLGLFKKRK